MHVVAQGVATAKAAKKKQHIIPQCYLSSFTDPVPPDGVSTADYKPAVWLVDKSLNKPPSRKGLQNALQKSYFYNLEEDKHNDPKIENILSIVEGKYANVLRSIENEKLLTNSDVADLTIFVDTLYRRTEASVEFWQSEFDKIEKMFRSVDYSKNHNEEYSDIYWSGSHEIGRSMIQDQAGVMAEILFKVGVNIVVNNSGLPFFTSDNPVTHRFSHIDELHSVSVPKSWTHHDIGTNEECFYCYCPLSPKYAFISSQFLKPTEGTIYRNIYDEKFVLDMNCMTQSHANSVIVSSSSRPHGIYQEHVVKALKYVKSEHANNQKGEKLKIYTDCQRFEITITNFVQKVFTNGHRTEVSFRTENISVLKTISSHERIDRILYFVDGKERAGSRSLKFHYVSVEKDESSILVG